MGTLSALYHSSIGKKLVVGLTGLCLCVYLVVHLGGNLLLYKGDGGAAFDAYAETLPNLLIIRIIEYVLFAIFLVHIFTGTYLWILNKRARPVQYAMNKPQENSSFFSRTMFLTGSIVFIFLVIHMKTFWFTSRFEAGEHFSMYALVRAAFADPMYSIFYVVAMGLLAFHLRHGFQSAFQTFGIKHQKYAPLIEAVGVIFWLVIPIAFASMPMYFLMNS
jgi:succinate dehydrogenase / fumarate reductase cytochrome b subunit